MTNSAGLAVSPAGKWISSLVAALALLSVWPVSCPAESGQTVTPAPGGLEIPPLTDGKEEKAQTPPPPPPRKNVPREDIVSGTEQAFGAYTGTWHDPVRDETVTTIITPRQPMMTPPPMYIAPQVYPNWDGSWSQGGGSYYYPSQRPSRPPYWDQGHRPPPPSSWDQGHRPPRPPRWDQGHRPPPPSSWGQGYRPPRPPHWDQGQPPSRPPHWGQGQSPSRPPHWQGNGIPPSWWRGSSR